MRKLYILWTSDNAQTAHFMVFMYAVNALRFDWWDEVTIIIWGSSATIAAHDESIRLKIKMAQHQGVKVSACVACAEQLGVADELREQGIEIKPWGLPLTEILQEGYPLITI